MLLTKDDGLPAGQEIFYRIRFQDLATPSIVGEPAVGRFRTAPSDRRSRAGPFRVNFLAQRARSLRSAA
jgi:phosphodiesterase/alkaline phosphatase D-like protein